MKTIMSAVALGISVGLASVAGPAQAQLLWSSKPMDWSGLYIGASGGWVHDSADYKLTNPAPATIPHASMSTNTFIVGGQGGVQYQWGPYVGGLELGALNKPGGAEAGKSNCYSGGGPGGTCNVEIGRLFTAGAKFGYAWNAFLPYITAGYADAPVKSRFTNNGGIPFDRTERDHQGWYVGAGVDFMAIHGDPIDVIVGGRYQHADLGEKFHGSTADLFSATGVNGRRVSAREDMVLLQISLKWNPFAAPAIPAAAVAAPPPPAAVAPQKQVFIVFFEFDKSSLTADGRKVVDAAATAFKSGKSGVAIAGYTDLSGTQQYNLALSKRRADTVKQALVRDGVPASAIDEKWFGKQNPRVPTADGVREPQNRRVEITM